jgi:hypothetical protein
MLVAFDWQGNFKMKIEFKFLEKNGQNQIKSEW